MSENATKITRRIQYDSKTKRLVGLVAPLNENGLPDASHFIISCSNQIKEFMKNYETDSYVYAVLVKPIKENSPSFVLCLFGTNNKFDYKTVLKRWQYIISQLRKLSIEVLGKNNYYTWIILNNIHVYIFTFPFCII